MIRRRAAAATARPRVQPDSGSLISSFPQVTCPDRPGGPVLPPLSACGLRPQQALVVLAWSGDGSPVWGCTTMGGGRVPPRTPRVVLYHHPFKYRLNTRTARLMPAASPRR